MNRLTFESFALAQSKTTHCMLRTDMLHERISA
jgi:hypothetical protein